MPPIFTRGIQRALLLTCHNPLVNAYRAITLYGIPFQGISASPRWVAYDISLHISTCFHRRIQFALCRVRSPLLTASQLVSFPAGTKMLQFPAFPFANANYLGSPSRESHSGTPGSKATCASPGLFAACHALHWRYEPSHSLDGVQYPIPTGALA